MQSNSPTLARQSAFLAAYAVSLNVIGAATAAGIDPSTHYEWLKRDKSYPQRFEAAREAAADRLEAAAMARAVEGVTDYVVSQGKLVYVDDPDNPGQRIPLVKRVYSDALAQLLLKGHKPNRYRERQSIEHTGKDGGPIQMLEVTLEIADPDDSAAQPESTED